MEYKRVNSRFLLIFASIMLFLGGMLCIFGGNTTKIADAATGTDSYYCLRDEMYIPTENQYAYGQCWQFSLLKMIETSIVKNTGEYYDFSNAWIAIAQKLEGGVVVGKDGSHFPAGFNFIKEYGLVLESDLNFDELNYINNSNYEEYYDQIKQYADKNITNNLVIDAINKNEIKSALINNSAVGVSIYKYIYVINPLDGTLYLDYADNEYAHAVTIIGWDDNYEVEISGSVHKGAYIVLNSYGSDWGDGGVFYYPYYIYEQGQISTLFYEIEYNAPTIDIELLSTNDYFIDVKNLHNQNVGYTTSSAKTMNTNLYDYEENDIELTYKLSDYLNYTNVDVNVYKSNSLVYDFDITHSNGIYTITEKADVSPLGTYKVEFVVDGTVINKCFVVLSGLELGYIDYTDSVDYLDGLEFVPVYKNFNTSNNQLDIYVKTSRLPDFLVIVPSIYNDYVGYDYNEDLFSFVDNSSYWRLWFKAVSYDVDEIYNLTLFNEEGESLTYNIHIDVDSENILLNVQYDVGDKAVNINPEYISIKSETDTKVYIDNPSVQGKVVKSIYYYNIENQKVNLGYSEEQGKFYITELDVQYASENNGLTDLYYYEAVRYYLILHFEYIEGVSMDIRVVGESGLNSTRFDYGESLKATVNVEGVVPESVKWYTDGNLVFNPNKIKLNAGQYVLKCVITYNDGYTDISIDKSVTITIVPITLTVTQIGETFTYNGTDQVPTFTVAGFLDGDQNLYEIIYPEPSVNAGDYVVTINSKSVNYVLKTNTYSYKIEKQKITITLDNKSSKIGEALAQLTYTVSGTLYDELNIQPSANILSTLAGVYAITASYTQNSNYDVTVVTGKYTLLSADSSGSGGGAGGDDSSGGNEGGNTNTPSGGDSSSEDDNHNSGSNAESKNPTNGGKNDVQLVVYIAIIVGGLTVIVAIISLVSYIRNKD